MHVARKWKSLKNKEGRKRKEDSEFRYLIMKEFTYCVTLKNGNCIYQDVQAVDVVEGHWKIYRQYENKYIKAHLVRHK